MRSYKRLLLVACLLFSETSIVHSQQLFVQKYPEEVYRGSNQNWYFAQDSAGVLYVANDDGVLSFDGNKWDLLSLPGHDYAFCMAFDTRGWLYVGSKDEIGYLQKDEWGKYQYQSLIGLLPPANRDVKDIGQAISYRDTVIFAGPGYIYVYFNGRFKIFPSKAAGLLKFGGRAFLLDDKGLFVYKNSGFEPAEFDQEIRDRGIKIRRIKDYTGNLCLLLDDKRHLWVLDPDAAPGKRLRPFSARLEAFCKNIPIITMAGLDNGMIALLLEKGMLFVDKDGEPANFISTEMFGTDVGQYARLFQDIHHNLWVTARDSYIFQIITSSPLSYYDKYNGIQGHIISFGKKDGYSYVGTTKGIFYQESDKRFAPVLLTDGETWNFYSFHKRLYVAQEAGVFELEGTKLRQLVDLESVHCLTELKGRPDCLVMGTYDDGIWLMEKKGETWQKRKIKGYETSTGAICNDSTGNIWINDFSDRIVRLRLNERLDSAVGVTLYDERNGLPAKTGNRVFQLKNGSLIAATSKGIYEYDQESDRFTPSPEFAKVLPKDYNIVSIDESPEGDIYFRSESSQFRHLAGCLHWQPGGGYKLIQTPFYKMAVPAHDPGGADDDPLLIVSPTEIWMGAGEKLVTYNPAKKTFYDDPMPLFIDKAWAKDSLIFTTGRYSDLRREVAYSYNRLRFKFISPYFEEGDKVDYQYSLDGLDNKWSDWSSDKEAIFTNLQEGKYTFRVRTRNMYGKISEPVSFSFTILPPWFRTWWAYFLYGLSTLALLYVLIKINARRINLKNSILEKRVDEKTREIIDQAKVLRELNTTKDKLFSIISHDLRGPIGTMKAVVDLMKNPAMSEHEVRSFSVELSEHLLVTGHLLNNLLFWSKTQMQGMRSVATQFDLQEIAAENCRLFKALVDSKCIRLINTIEPCSAVYADRDIIKMVLRNLINNAIKFTRSGGEIVISAVKTEDHMKIAVKDTGIGLSQDEISRIVQKQVFHKPDTEGQFGAGLGLMLCMELIEKDGAILEIESEPGKGSRFSIKIPSPRRFL